LKGVPGTKGSQQIFEKFLRPKNAVFGPVLILKNNFFLYFFLQIFEDFGPVHSGPDFFQNVKKTQNFFSRVPTFISNSEYSRPPLIRNLYNPEKNYKPEKVPQ
jgi:hypothetical protein